MPRQKHKKILVLGGGFGGVYTAMTLQKALKHRADIDISLVNQDNYFVFQPMLAEVISGSIGIVNMMASIMAPATPFFFCTTQKHLTVKRASISMA
jgi:NADH:quinone reductase (non-electrogenic)